MCIYIYIYTCIYIYIYIRKASLTRCALQESGTSRGSTRADSLFKGVNYNRCVQMM